MKHPNEKGWFKFKGLDLPKNLHTVEVEVINLPI